MRGTPTTFWGKLTRNAAGEVTDWHPLVAHCADVAAVVEALLTRTILGIRFAHILGMGTLDRCTIAKLCVLAALHDIGKFNHGFQAKSLPLGSKVERRGHTTEGLSLFNPPGPDPEILALQERLPLADFKMWGEEESIGLLLASISHHGRPGDVDAARFEREIWRPRGGKDPGEGLGLLVSHIKGWFPEAFSGVGTLPSAPAFQHAYAGLVMLADWVGSDSSEGAFRYQTDLDPSDRMVFSRAQAAKSLVALGLDVETYRTSLGIETPKFGNIWTPYQPNSAQQAVIDLRLALKSGMLSLLESETGSGKTEAAIIHFLRLFHLGLVDGLYFALPTRTAATQIHKRVVDAVAKAFPDSVCRPPVVLAVPGYLRIDEIEGRKLLPGFEVLWNDDPLRAQRYRGWAAELPKRFLAGAIAVGTIDQALLSALQVDHAHLRSTALLRHLLVVDEVHASDAYGTRLLTEVLGTHLSAGGHALLLSATLGTEARTRLFTPQDAPPQKPPPLSEAKLAPYPALTTRIEGETEVVVRTIKVSSTSVPKYVMPDLRPWIRDPSKIIAEALEAARRGARIIILRNTVGDCVATQKALETAVAASGEGHLLFRCKGVSAPHHSRFAREDRNDLDVAIGESFGRNGKHHFGMIAVTTQTIQQSLDLDADLLITDLCPMDILLQRIGRLHRHPIRVRPEGYGKPRVVVLVPTDRNLGKLIGPKGEARGRHGFGRVYEDLRILEATWRLLETESVLEIPTMNRHLVEHTTHPEALGAIVRELGGVWPVHQIRVDGIRLASSGVAMLNLVRRDQPFGELATCFPSKGEDSRRIPTRLGEGDRRLVFQDSFESPFGHWIRELSVQGWLADGAASDGAAIVMGVSGESTLISSGDAIFVYDRLGLRKGDNAL
jgi:CRISPR-associated endonuclease/helicase Cas3